MEYGDKIAIVDANYPAKTMGRWFVVCLGISAIDLLKNIVVIFPMRHIVSEPALLMVMTEVDQKTMPEPEIWTEFVGIVHEKYGKEKKVGKLNREGFYEASRDAYLINSKWRRASVREYSSS